MPENVGQGALGTNKKVIAIYEDGEVKQVVKEFDEKVTCISVSLDARTIWVGTEHNFLYSYNIAGGYVRHERTTKYYSVREDGSKTEYYNENGSAKQVDEIRGGQRKILRDSRQLCSLKDPCYDRDEAKGSRN